MEDIDERETKKIRLGESESDTESDPGNAADECAEEYTDDLRSAAYGIDDTSNNVGCSGHPGRFCFFCEFVPNPEATSDPATTLRNMVREMMDANCEVSTICQKVHAAYKADVQEKVVWENPLTNVMEDTPDWTLKAIECHLIHSSEFKQIFSDVVEKCFESIILRQNNNMFSGKGKNALPNPETHDQFLQTVKTYIAFKKSQQMKGKT